MDDDVAGRSEGREPTIRRARGDDAEAFLALLLALDTESEFMLFEPGERGRVVAAVRARLVDAQARGQEVLFVAVRERTGEAVVAREPPARDGSADEAIGGRPVGEGEASGESVLDGYVAGIRGPGYRGGHALNLVLGVRREASGRGLGGRLLATLEAHARERGIHRLGLGVLSTNRRAIALYERAGFVREGSRRDAVRLRSGYVDEWFMGKLLARAASGRD